MDPHKTLRIFADHYQFFVYNQGCNPFDPLPDYTEQTIEQGWTRSPGGISFSTRAHRNDHRLDVFICETLPSLRGFDRATVHPFDVKSGRLALHDIEETILAELPEGQYSIVLAAYNLGAEQPLQEGDLPESEFLHNKQWERYEIYICPPVGSTDSTYSIA